jgi:hypothetical protein
MAKNIAMCDYPDNLITYGELKGVVKFIPSILERLSGTEKGHDEAGQRNKELLGDPAAAEDKFL